MSKRIKIIMFCFLVITASSTFAQTMKAKKKIVQKCFVDANKNSLCDKIEKKTCKIGNGTGYADCKTNKNPKK